MSEGSSPSGVGVFSLSTTTMTQLHSSISLCLRRRFSVSTTSPSSSSATSVPAHPPRPVIDYNRITSNRNACAKNLVDRKSHLTPDAIEDVAYLYSEYKNLSKKLVEAKQRQNSLGNKIKEAIGSLTPATKENSQNRAKDEEELLLSTTPLPSKKSNDSLHQSLGGNLELAAKVKDYHSEAATLKDAISNLSKDGVTLEQRLLDLATQLPNEIHPSVPIGAYEQSEIVSLSSGCTLSADPLPFNSFELPSRPPDPNRDHLKVMTELGWLSFSDGQKTTGPSFPFLVGNGAFLELALTQYAISLAVRSGWNLTLGPDIVRTELSDRCGFSPRDGGESNHTYFVSTHKTNQTDSEEGDRSLEHLSTPNLCLAATAEIPLVGSFHSSTLPNKTYPTFPLNPIQLVSLGTAYRAEAGSRGSESRGLYRIHQFKKVEMMAITGSDLTTSEKMLQKMLELQIQIVSSLNLPYRVLEMSSQELGASAYHKYDIETWMPGRGRWGEVSSASNCTDYQSRRLGIRSKARQPCPDPCTGPEDSAEGGRESKPVTGRKASDKPAFVHTLNATAAAMPRLIVSLIENGVILDQNNRVTAVKLPAPLKNFWLGEATNIEWVPSKSSP
ncbi:uncharacterized protein PGTG_13508 [Puccinia graminis f. sp. tritici CRL 75-36-700-3]|uniref:serine--tRNA ligase n=1 Tax=Puccinia graminis f. sp. tritici (strain CRL 75-36-700-3 / race SCCL) TaxID=418459 RepID=E3KTL5_PUCGT|nr:uncharacterized protein PGTG_13508 [Puccinia graminis f. sp. tritici CRL 75-36-700-3]EFP87722.2 hypothetical protein PGTG_13508 [Puccinia graminis f. sp. tritici CRL 75-36-700-3]